MKPPILLESIEQSIVTADVDPTWPVQQCNCCKLLAEKSRPHCHIHPKSLTLTAADTGRYHPREKLWIPFNICDQIE